VEGAWLASYVILWVLVVALSLLALSHSRLIGLLYRRIGPGAARPLAEGPAAGTRVEEIRAATTFGQPWVRRFPVEADSLAVFVSPLCQACNELMPHVKDFLARFGPRVDLHLFSVLADPAMNRAYVGFAGLDRVPYLIADRFATDLQVPGTPYALKLDRRGVVIAGGVVNHFEHLVSLWNATSPPPEADLTDEPRITPEEAA
jgi:methylamine dehydrogenase accessory protein MauD